MISQPQSPSVRAEKHQAALSESLRVFRDAADRFPVARRHDRPREGAFSAAEIVYHLVGVEELWQSRFNSLLTGGTREFTAMDADEDARENRYNDRDFEEGVKTLIRKRDDTLAFVGQMTDEQLELTCKHSRYGDMSLDRMLETIEAHDRQHAAQLDRTARELEALLSA